MRIEIVVREFNDTLYEFEFKVNKTIKHWEEEYKEIKDVNILYEGKTLIAIIKYI